MTDRPAPSSGFEEFGLQANPTLGPKLLVSALGGPGTPTVRLSGSVAPKKPSGTCDTSYLRPRFNVRSGRTRTSSCTKRNACHCDASNDEDWSCCWNLN